MDINGDIPFHLLTFAKDEYVAALKLCENFKHIKLCRHTHVKSRITPS